MFHFSSPLIVYPKAKQKRYAAIFLIPFLALSLWRAFSAYEARALGAVCSSLALLVCVIWLVCSFIKDSTRDITVVLLPSIVICALQIIDKLFPIMFSKEEIGILFIMEIAFWITFAFFFVKGILGKCKIIIPMLFLFFGFFYAFIVYDLRAELPTIGTQITLFLLLWFVLDAATFTSLPEEEMR